MDIPILEIIKGLKPLNPENVVNLFSDQLKFIINKKHLLLLTLEQTTLEKAIFEDGPNSKFVFTKESLAMVLEEDVFSEKFSKKQLLNIFANQNGSLIGIILDLKIFDEIYIINDIEDYEAEALNISQGGDLSFELLEKKSLKEQIFIKYLTNRKGEINLKYIDHLKKCIFFMDPKKTKVNNDYLKFFLNVDKSILQKITKKFNLRKFLFYIYDQYSLTAPTQQQIENLMILNGSFIDSRILDLIMNNYHGYSDENQIWLENIFNSYDSYFTNYDVAYWINKNLGIYNQNYSKIDQFHQYTFHDSDIYQFFCSNDFFVEQLVEYSHLVSFLMEKLSNPLEIDKDYEEIVCEMIEFVLKNRSQPDFHQVASNPEKILFKIKEYDLTKQMNKSVLLDDTKITLKFKNHDIATSLKELFDSTNWDDLSDFKQKVRQKEINIDEVLSLNNLKSRCEILKSVGISDVLFDCSICCRMEPKDTYIFVACSHFICKTCINDYIASKGLNITKKSDNGNLFSIFLSPSEKNSLPCPTCKKESIIKENTIQFLKLYI